MGRPSGAVSAGSNPAGGACYEYGFPGLDLLERGVAGRRFRTRDATGCCQLTDSFPYVPEFTGPPPGGASCPWSLLPTIRTAPRSSPARSSTSADGARVLQRGL